MTSQLHPDVEKVARALVELCFRAGVQPGDGSAAAGRAVGAVLRAEIAAQNVVNCPLNTWVCRAADVPRAVVTVERVVLPHIVAGELPRSRARQEQHGSRGRVFATVELPPALKAAVAGYDRKDWALKNPQEGAA